MVSFICTLTYMYVCLVIYFVGISTHVTSARKHKLRDLKNFDISDIAVKSNDRWINTTVTGRHSDRLDQMRPQKNKLQKSAINTNNANSSNMTEHLKNLTLRVPIEGRTFVLDLQLNEHLFPSTYTEKMKRPDGHTFADIDVIRDHCYYTGSVRGYNDSIAAVSTCHGIVGFFTLENETYHIEPMDEQNGCMSCKHKVFTGAQDEDILNKSRCGLARSKTLAEAMASRKKRAVANQIQNWPQDLYPQTKIVEAYIVIDHGEYLAYNSAVTARIKNIFNMASAIYQPLDIYLVLVGLEVWTTVDLIVINVSSSDQTLNNFAAYSQSSISVSRDNTQLVTSEGSYDGTGTVGLANVGRMCTPNSVLFISDYFSLPASEATILSHELGHNFGLLHDDLYDNVTCACSDPSGHCVMYSVTSTTNVWSLCSKTNLTTNLPIEDQSCLYNMPTSVFDSTPLCGNGFVDPGEQCDCGNAPTSECNSNCCNNVTCQLVAPAQCAFGKCCNIPTCTYKPAFVACRPNAASCDLSEYCSGIGGVCPADVYKQDYSNCVANGVSAFCYAGACVSRASQCQTVWGPGVGDGISQCYTLNVQGIASGNCGLVNPNNSTVFKPCQSANALCGELQCNDAAITPINQNYDDYYTSTVASGSVVSKCNSVVYTSSSTGMVPNGASCSADNTQVCLNQVCTNVIGLKAACPNCNNHGICNSLNQCHCDVGYAPSDCSQPGNGGSLASNGIVLLAHSILALAIGVPLAVFLALVLAIILCVCCLPRVIEKHKKRRKISQVVPTIVVEGREELRIPGSKI